MMAVDFLSEAGYLVHEAGHAEEAVRILERHCDGVHVLFTDIHMPGVMDGLQLAHHAHRHWPWIGLLVASGKAAPKAPDMPPRARFLPKPYDPMHVLDHLRALVAADQVHGGHD